MPHSHVPLLDGSTLPPAPSSFTRPSTHAIVLAHGCPPGAVRRRRRYVEEGVPHCPPSSSLLLLSLCHRPHPLLLARHHAATQALYQERSHQAARLPLPLLPLFLGPSSPTSLLVPRGLIARGAHPNRTWSLRMPRSPSRALSTTPWGGRRS